MAQSDARGISMDSVIVIGAGPAGLMAAGRAAELGARVILLEKTAQPGNKLALTGNGRCNLAHEGDPADLIAHVYPDGSFLRNGLARFSVPELKAFFRALGVRTVTESDGRVFPASYDAREVTSALVRYGQAHGVEFRYASPVAEICAAKGQVSGVRLKNGERMPARRVILATGGLSYPRTGSTGDGLDMARALGHTVVPPRPGLVPLVTRESFVRRLQGLALYDVGVSVWRNTQMLAHARGDVLFTHFGLSGPLPLSLSLRLVDDLGNPPLRFCLDLRPTLTEEQLDEQLRSELASRGRASYQTLLKDWLPRSLVGVFAELSGVPERHPLNQMTATQRRRIVHLMKSFDLTIVGTRPIREAMVTVGGVSTKEINPQTMASRLVGGLYFAGEVMDLAGDTGGYNLQIAFTTGRIAGESAAICAT